MKHTDFTPDYLTNLNLSRKLAVAIGWKESDLRVIANDQLYVKFRDDFNMGTKKYPYVQWKPFSYLDPKVIYKIAQAYDCFPSAQVEGDYVMAKRNDMPTITGWEVLIWSYEYGIWNKVEAPTPELAIALAVVNRNVVC